ncbi:hypothetical protein [Priestia megaterium]|uniref:hypothetical protein n=1 Tax=Priestia megaterium TaxID=1404 RepID=UPI0036722297
MSEITKRQEVSLRCHDIASGLSRTDVVDYENISEVGLMVRLALHIRGLSAIPFQTLKLAAHHFLNIPPLLCGNIVTSLAEIGFVKIDSEGKTIKTVIPTVPYYEDLYENVGEYAELKSLNEPEELAISILKRLTSSPMSLDTAFNLGAERSLVERSLLIGQTGNYINQKRCRGKDILISPIYFSENIDVYTDLVAKSGAKNVQKVLKLIEQAQGIPLHIIESRKEINGVSLSDEEINLLKSLAYDSVIKPPSIVTSHAGSQYFLFTPKPGSVRLSPTKKEIFEKAMALVSAVRQGQYLPKQYAIKSPYAILNKLKTAYVIKANTEAAEQYKQLTFLKVGSLVHISGNWHEFHLIDTEENLQALDIALDLVNVGRAQGMEIDDNMTLSIEKGQTYIESLIGSQNLMKERGKVDISEEHEEEIADLFLKGVH